MTSLRVNEGGAKMRLVSPVKGLTYYDVPASETCALLQNTSLPYKYTSKIGRYVLFKVYSMHIIGLVKNEK